jgi:hypothetical protein
MAACGGLDRRPKRTWLNPDRRRANADNDQCRRTVEEAVLKQKIERDDSSKKVIPL